MSHPKSCTHIKVTGVRCGSPTLRGEQFCYFHQRMLRTVRVPASRVHHAALLEDAESIQASLMEVVNGLLRGTLELKRGELILRALNTAVRNIRRVHFDLHQEDMVREIPNYPTPPLIEVDEQAAAEAERQAARAEIERVKAEHLAEYYARLDKASAQAATPAPTNVATNAFVRPPNVAIVGADHVGTDHVGTAALGCPGGPEVPGRSAVPPKPTTSTPAEVNRKPPASVKEARMSSRSQAPKERKIAAHRASGG